MAHINCSLFGHDYRLTKKVTLHVSEYVCKNCKKEFTVDANGSIIPLTQKFKEINSVLERVHNSKLRRIQSV